VLGENFLEVNAFYCQNSSKSMKGFKGPSDDFRDRREANKCMIFKALLGISILNNM
jgi:hypothetical protein